jgi:RpiR family transcriptional regulator, carbohydrate utilization regulator
MVFSYKIRNVDSKPSFDSRACAARERADMSTVEKFLSGQTHALPLLAQIEASRDRLSTSEARVAEVVLSNPNRAVELSIAALALKAGVSEPSVARFCKAVGFAGLKDFKLNLARTLGNMPPRPREELTEFDSAGSAAAKVIDRSIESLTSLRNSLDSRVLGEAAQRIATARRLEFYGQGNSGIVAQDGQHKFFRLGIPTGASSDPHVHAMSAALLKAGDVVVAISASGRTLDIIRSIEIARDSGAWILGITTRGSPLTALCHAAVAVDLIDEGDVYAPMTSRLLHLAILDALAVLVALNMGPQLSPMVERARGSVIEKRSG